MQAELLPQVVEALWTCVGVLWTAAWAIIVGLVITSLVQVSVSRVRMAAVLGEGNVERTHQGDAVRGRQ